MTDLARRQSTTTNALAMPKKATLTPTGLVVADDLTGDEWLDIGRVLVCAAEATQMGPRATCSSLTSGCWPR